ncbi:hypothetical protein UlMin_036291 [Ulmus minor]
MALNLNLIATLSLKHQYVFSFQPMARLRSPKSYMTLQSHIKGTKNVKSLKERNRNIEELPAEKVEIFKSIEGWAVENLLPMLKPVNESWQPQDFLPDPSTEGFYEQIKEIRERTKEIPDEYLVVLVGNMITEEALPTYQSRLSGTQIFNDQTGADNTPWAIWTRGWSAEENRHGDLLNKYLYLSGRVDMKQIEKTIQYLIGAGMDVGSGNHPYYGSIYTSFQERATFVSHGNTAKLAKKHGDTKLARICGTIASDEKRHETAYSTLAAKLFELDPNDMVLVLADMMRRQITMPAHLMYDGYDPNLFQHFCGVASRIGIYTATDYINNLEHFVAKWNIEKLTGLSSEGREAQDYVCGVAQRIKRIEERLTRKAQQETPMSFSFSWIFHRHV